MATFTEEELNSGVEVDGKVYKLKDSFHQKGTLSYQLGFGSTKVKCSICGKVVRIGSMISNGKRCVNPSNPRQGDWTDRAHFECAYGQTEAEYFAANKSANPEKIHGWKMLTKEHQTTYRLARMEGKGKKKNGKAAASTLTVPVFDGVRCVITGLMKSNIPTLTARVKSHGGHVFGTCTARTKLTHLILGKDGMTPYGSTGRYSEKYRSALAGNPDLKIVDEDWVNASIAAGKNVLGKTAEEFEEEKEAKEAKKKGKAGSADLVAAQAVANSQIVPVFEGVKAIVTGMFTKLKKTIPQITEMIVDHGGVVHSAVGPKTVVTHIILGEDQMTLYGPTGTGSSKYQTALNRDPAPKVVDLAWVEQAIAAGKNVLGKTTPATTPEPKKSTAAKPAKKGKKAKFDSEDDESLEDSMDYDQIDNGNDDEDEDEEVVVVSKKRKGAPGKKTSTPKRAKVQSDDEWAD